jgi:hypothetical protein
MNSVVSILLSEEYFYREITSLSWTRNGGSTKERNKWGLQECNRPVLWDQDNVSCQLHVDLKSSESGEVLDLNCYIRKLEFQSACCYCLWGIYVHVFLYSNPKISSVEMKYKMADRLLVKLSKIHLKIKSADLQGNWVTIGVIVHKTEPRTSSSVSFSYGFVIFLYETVFIYQIQQTMTNISGKSILKTQGNGKYRICCLLLYIPLQQSFWKKLSTNWCMYMLSVDIVISF